DCNILSSEWAKRLKGLDRPILFVGQDADIHREAITDSLGELAVFAPIQSFNSRPSELAFLGLDKTEEDIHKFVPNYIRMAPFQKLNNCLLRTGYDEAGMCVDEGLKRISSLIANQEAELQQKGKKSNTSEAEIKLELVQLLVKIYKMSHKEL
ncbi:hypothetical protein CVN76_00310, partial [Bacillus sp. mrc49]